MKVPGRAKRVMAILDQFDIRIIKCVNTRNYTRVGQIMAWLENDIPSIAILYSKLDKLSEMGLIKYKPEFGYIRTVKGDGISASTRR